MARRGATGLFFIFLFPPTRHYLDLFIFGLERTHRRYSTLLLFMREHYDLDPWFQANLSGGGR